MKITANGIGIRYELEGPATAPVVVMSHSLAANVGMWGDQMSALSGFRVLRYDTRGHGGTDAPEGDYTLDQLAGDLFALLDALEIRPGALRGALDGRDDRADRGPQGPGPLPQPLALRHFEPGSR